MICFLKTSSDVQNKNMKLRVLCANNRIFMPYMLGAWLNVIHTSTVRLLHLQVLVLGNY